MGTLKTVDLEWLDRAPWRNTTETTLRHPPAAVFAELADNPGGWGRWFPGFSNSGHYLGAAPHGVDSVREVRVGGLTFTERVLAWDEPTRWAFGAERSPIPGTTALAEDYRLAAAPGGSVLTWTFALDPGRLPAAALAPLPAVLRAVIRRACAKLDVVLDG